MTLPTPAHLVFVDFENVPDIDLGSIATHSVNVTLLIGKNQKRLDLPLVQQIHRLAAQVALIEVGATGHNALDLTLAYHLGQAVQQSPQAKFHIVSKDTDFDALVAHLRTHGVTIHRHPSFAALPFLPRPKKSPPPASAPAPKPSIDRRAKIIARLTDPANPNHPSTKRALLANIKTGLGKEGTTTSPDDIVRELIETGVVTIDPDTNKVRYTSDE